MSAPKPQQKWRSVDPSAWVDPKSRPPRPVQQPAPRTIKGVEDIRQTKEYKTAARRWTSAIVGLPIVMYTSWILYERIYGNKSAKRLVPLEKKE
ncbi:hypothetical protein PENARI_c001G00735 [Penicillium arizonense]|uniref:Uncharacterized protein n=1 Tax=Penicillium arizonense TaxID=1835702 RepID=A0A1F5LXM8_PENAI|nr:hypothetical protein PENARI_c001G00735 [Penicillium arizonense]OGE57910.1 hypothetical protein PENARI_c001G00735 [Penicillium arizonense]